MNRHPTNVLLRVENLKKYFPVKKGIVFQKTVAHVKAVDGIELSIRAGETIAVVGESGSGKSTLGTLILKVIEPTSGSIWFRGKDVAQLHGSELKDYRESVQAMFQDPYSSLNPRMRIRSIIAEPLVISGVDRQEIDTRVRDAISRVGMDERSLDLYPHEFSGGQRQRIALARALIRRPELVVLDEPVSALDVSIRAQIMNDMKDIQKELGLSYLLIAHGLETVRFMSDTVAVMYLGRIVEIGPSEDVFKHPSHPYTKALLAAALPSHPDKRKEEFTLLGEVPSAINIPSGCRFHPRCPIADSRCAEVDPASVQVGDDHLAACLKVEAGQPHAAASR